MGKIPVNLPFSGPSHPLIDQIRQIGLWIGKYQVFGKRQVNTTILTKPYRNSLQQKFIISGQMHQVLPISIDPNKSGFSVSQIGSTAHQRLFFGKKKLGQQENTRPLDLLEPPEKSVLTGTDHRAGNQLSFGIRKGQNHLLHPVTGKSAIRIRTED